MKETLDVSDGLSDGQRQAESISELVGELLIRVAALERRVSELESACTRVEKQCQP